MTVTGPKYDELTHMIAWEQGTLDHEATIDLFTHLLDTGTLWHLQGAYAREAVRLGLIDRSGARITTKD